MFSPACSLWLWRASEGQLGVRHFSPTGVNYSIYSVCVCVCVPPNDAGLDTAVASCYFVVVSSKYHNLGLPLPTPYWHRTAISYFPHHRQPTPFSFLPSAFYSALDRHSRHFVACCISEGFSTLSASRLSIAIVIIRILSSARGTTGTKDVHGRFLLSLWNVSRARARPSAFVR